MARLLEVYEDMLKEAEFAKVAEEVQFMFAKYAETAKGLLKEEYDKDFNIDDVESLARGLMERDSEIIEESEKVAEYDAVGRQLAQMFVEEMKTAAHIPFDAAGVGGSKVKELAKKVLQTTSSAIRRKPLLSVGGGVLAGIHAGAALAGGDK